MKSRMTAATFGASLIALSAMPACAQDAASQKESAQADPIIGNAEIIVTARRRSESLQDVPLSVNAVTSEQVQKLNIRNFSEVQNLVPGLQMTVEPSGLGGSGQLRGVSYSGNTGANPSVAFYQNDAPIEASALLQNMYDVGGIEVLRGPQGTLRGEAAPSGSITVTTKKPDLNRSGGNLTMTANNIGTQNINGGIGIPIIEGVAAIRLAGLYQEDEVNRVRTIASSGDLRGPFGLTKSGRASLLVAPTDWLRLEGVYQYTLHRTRMFDQYESYNLLDRSFAPGGQTITVGNRQSIEETPTYIQQKYNSYNWRAELRHWGQVLIYQGAHNDTRFDVTTDQDSANFIVGSDFYNTTQTAAHTTSHEVRLQNERRIFGSFDYVLGFYSFQSNSISNILTQTPLFYGSFYLGTASTPISAASLGKSVERAEFGNITAHPGAGFEISGGLRHIHSSTPPGVLTIAGSPILSDGKTDDGWIYSGSIKKNFTKDFMVYASTGTSRRPGPRTTGDFSVLPSALEQSFTNLPTETSRSYEIGLKSSWFEERLRLNLTGYHQTFKNYAYYNNSGTYAVNYGATVTNGVVTITPGVQLQRAFVAPVPVEVNGLEGQLTWDVTPRWNVDITGSYSLGKIKNGIVPCNDLNRDGIPDAGGAPPTLAQLQAVVGANNLSTCRVTQRSSGQAPFSMTATSEYTMPVSTSVNAFMRGLLTFLGDSQGDPTYAFDSVKSYGLLNIFAGLRDQSGRWELSLFAKNVTGVNRMTAVYYGGQAQTNYQQLATGVGVSALANYAQISSTPPREFGATLHFSFGSR